MIASTFARLEGRRLGLAGGGVYDALVGATASEHHLRLVTCDRRALSIYRKLEVDAALLP